MIIYILKSSFFEVPTVPLTFLLQVPGRAAHMELEGVALGSEELGRPEKPWETSRANLGPSFFWGGHKCTRNDELLYLDLYTHM